MSLTLILSRNIAQFAHRWVQFKATSLCHRHRVAAGRLDDADASDLRSVARFAIGAGMTHPQALPQGLVEQLQRLAQRRAETSRFTRSDLIARLNGIAS